jgi:hypothetical protein
MKLKTYKCLRGHYSGKDNITITVPEGERFIYFNDSIGDGLHCGHNHYMMILKASDYTTEDIDIIMDNNKWLRYDEFGDLYVLTCKNILFEENVPTFESYKDLNEIYDINNYYIIYKKPDHFDDEILNEIKESKITLEEVANHVHKGEIFNVSKIIKVHGPYNVEVFNVSIGSILEGVDNFEMSVDANMEFTRLCPDIFFNKIEKIITKDPTEFNKLKEIILSKIHEN